MIYGNNVRYAANQQKITGIPRRYAANNYFSVQEFQGVMLLISRKLPEFQGVMLLISRKLPEFQGVMLLISRKLPEFQGVMLLISRISLHLYLLYLAPDLQRFPFPSIVGG
ncbi:hypothetical protein RIR_jg12777.t1 [Rhizophagus irregularis DAOM 181602=DAOM 197198]|nr:hypothetical protein RIR_jg12777.t1 [Rhizophagus irregularis DAOM 181602=DAOM 197198]